MLAEAVHGLAKVADHVVAVDGAYALFPSAKTRSHPEQAEAIIRACETENVPVTIHRPNQLFVGNEVEKRNLSLRLAGVFAEPGDWVLVWDSDFHLVMCEPKLVRHQLENTDLLAATYTILDGTDLMADEHRRHWSQVRPADWEWTVRTRCVYRWAADLAYTSSHFVMAGTYDGELRYVYGPDLVGGRDDTAVREVQCPAEHLGRALVVYHRRDERPLRRREDAEEYYRRRDAAGIETIDFGDGPVDPDTGRLLEETARA